jgi:aspartate/methionine/tyrosine aminotransferase
VSDYQQQSAGIQCQPEDVIITSGASEAAELILTALLNKGDEVLVPCPGYPLYPAILNKLDATPVYYHLDPTGEWQPDAEEVRRLISPRTRALLLINPNNPTGSITRDDSTRRLLEIAAEHNLLVISDEVYGELCFDKPPVSASLFAERMNLPMVTLESLSKTHQLSGWRVGWMRFTHQEKMRELAGAIMKLAGGRLCSPTPAQYAVKPALAMNGEYVAGFLGEVKKRRDAAIACVEASTGGSLQCIVPGAAFYLFVKAIDPQHRTDEQFSAALLRETGILIVPGSGFGMSPEDGYFRLVCLADEQTLRGAFRRIESFMNE